MLPDGRYAVGDSGGHKLIIYDAGGKQHATWGGAASGSDTFNDVSDLVQAADGKIVALDAENADIRIFDEDGKQVSEIPRGKMGLTHARGIAVGPDGKLYVADTAGNRVVRISTNGDIEQVFQQGSNFIKGLDQPLDLVVGPDGSVYVVDLLKRIVKFNPLGQVQNEWQVPIGGKSGGSKLALWDGLLMISNPDNNNIVALDPEKGTLLTLSAPTGSPLQLDTPTGLAVGPGDKLYVVDSGGQRVVVLGQAQAAP